MHSSASFSPDPTDIADLIRHADTLDDAEVDADATEGCIDGETSKGYGTDDEGLDPVEDEDDLPDTFDDSTDADPGEDQDAYGIAAE